MGTLSGYKIVEFAGIGPAPMCAMLLADMGADVLRIDRAEDAALGISLDAKYSLLSRGRKSVAIDLKKPELKYTIRKRIDNTAREQDTKAFLQRSLKDPLMAMLYDPTRLDRFAALHALAGMED